MIYLYVDEVSSNMMASLIFKITMILTAVNMLIVTPMWPVYKIAVNKKREHNIIDSKYHMQLRIHYIGYVTYGVMIIGYIYLVCKWLLG